MRLARGLELVRNKPLIFPLLDDPVALFVRCTSQLGKLLLGDGAGAVGADQKAIAVVILAPEFPRHSTPPHR